MEKLVNIAKKDFQLWEVYLEQFLEVLADSIIVLSWLFVYVFFIAIVLMIVCSIIGIIIDWIEKHKK